MQYHLIGGVLEREPGSGSIQFSAYGCIAPTHRLTYNYTCRVNDIYICTRVRIRSRALVPRPMARIHACTLPAGARRIDAFVHVYVRPSCGPYMHAYASSIEISIDRSIDHAHAIDHRCSNAYTMTCAQINVGIRIRNPTTPVQRRSRVHARTRAAEWTNVCMHASSKCWHLEPGGLQG